MQYGRERNFTMPESEFDLRVDAARKELKDPEQVTVQNGDSTSQPRFEVWHWGQSLCSQKVRTVLTEKEIEYRSNELSFREFENYRPGYVRLRMYAGIVTLIEVGRNGLQHCPFRLPRSRNPTR
jgi:hypothetical protein